MRVKFNKSSFDEEQKKTEAQKYNFLSPTYISFDFNDVGENSFDMQIFSMDAKELSYLILILYGIIQRPFVSPNVYKIAKFKIYPDKVIFKICILYNLFQKN